MSESYEDYRREYDGYLSRVRSFLASTRSASTLRECERVLREARRCAVAMAGLAEGEGDPARGGEARRRMEQEVRPLSDEVRRALEERQQLGGGAGSGASAATEEAQRSELFGGGSAARGGYRAPTLGGEDVGGGGSGSGGGDDEEGQASVAPDYLQESERLLLESQALCADSEQVGASTLQAMGQQREQLEGAAERLGQAKAAAEEATRILRVMGGRALRNRLFLQGVIAALIAGNLLVLYRIFRKE